MKTAVAAFWVLLCLVAAGLSGCASLQGVCWAKAHAAAQRSNGCGGGQRRTAWWSVGFAAFRRARLHPASHRESRRGASRWS